MHSFSMHILHRDHLNVLLSKRRNACVESLIREIIVFALDMTKLITDK